LTARASITPQLIMWVTGIVVALIVSLWFISNNPFNYLVEIDSIDEDLQQLSQVVMHACNTLTYYFEYNPVTEVGTIDFTENEICMKKGDLRRCVPTMCGINTTMQFELKHLTYIIIEKNEGITVSQV